MNQKIKKLAEKPVPSSSILTPKKRWEVLNNARKRLNKELVGRNLIKELEEMRKAG